MEDDIWQRAGRSVGGSIRSRGLLPEMVGQFLQTQDQLVRRTAARGGSGRDATSEAGSARIVRPNWRTRGRWKPDVIESRAANAMGVFDMLIRDGMSPAEAAAWAANAEAESGSGIRMDQNVPGGGRGVFMWNANRRANFPRAVGRSYEESTVRDQLAFPQWEFANDPYERQFSAPRVRKAETSNDPGIIAEAISRAYLRPRMADRDAADRGNLADEIYRRWGSRGPRFQRRTGPERQ